MKKNIVVTAIIFLSIGFILSYFLTPHITNKNEKAPEVKIAFAQPIKPIASNGSFVDVVKIVTPGVVKIISYKERTVSLFGDDFFGFDDFWKRFFDIPQRKEPVAGLGSGFFISSDGYIVTNNHVVEGAKKIRVFTYDGNEYEAEIKGTDPKTDLALIKVKGKNFKYLVFGDSSKVQVGEWVLAIGNPFGKEFTVTAGIISAKGRQLDTASYADFIQTDAAINQGNSGGPLVNMRGEVIGINSAILTPNMGNVGIGFAVPSNLAKKIIKQLKEKGKVERGWLGVQIQDITMKDKKALGLPSTHGALIAQVVPGSPADKAGLKEYDVIVKVNGREIRNATELKVIVGNTLPGTVLDFEIIRDGKTIHKKIKIGKRGESNGSGETSSEGGSEYSEANLGLTLKPLNSRIADEYGIPQKWGLLVLGVKLWSEAYFSGIRRGDIIIEANKRRMKTISDFRKELSYSKKSGVIILKVRRYYRRGNYQDTILSLRVK